MENKILPVEVLENSATTYLPRVTVKSQAIYTTILLAIIVLLILMPIIKVDVTVTSTGQVTTEFGRSEIKSLSSGILAEVKIKDNQLVKKDQFLFGVTNVALDTQLTINKLQQDEKEKYIQDLEQLTNNYSSATPLSALYKQELGSLKENLRIKERQRAYAVKSAERLRGLYSKGSASRVELEAAELKLNEVTGEMQSFRLEKLTKWQNDLAALRSEIRGLQSQLQQINEQKNMNIITAPIAGSIQLLSGKTTGSSVQAGEILAILSPDSNLLAECYVNPRDIGLIRDGMNVKFQVEAFNYNEWGMITGKVTDVAKDFILEQNSQPIYKIKCKLDKTELKLKNGYSGKLKKGMSLRGVFVVTKRSLMQLLYDNVDDWLNPVTNNRTTTAK